MRDDSIVQQYVVLPARGIVATEASASREIRSYLISLHSSMNNPGTLKRPQKSIIPMRILDSIHENGAKLVELSAQSASDLRAEQPGLRLVPVVYYYPQVHRPPLPLPSLRTATATVGTKIVVKVVSKKDGKPVGGALVVAFTDFANRIGAQGKTNKSGDAALALGSSSKKVERLYVLPEKNYWGSLKRNATLKAGFTVGITPVDLRYTDALRFFYGKSADTAGNGLTVGVIDTGVGPHSDLRVAGGENTVAGENSSDYHDNGEGHGTHVAGIIAACGKPPTGIRGLAPGVVLRSYRVFGKHAKGASNFAIAKAIDRAIEQGCDLINMSLGGGPADIATREAIADARARGCLVLAASGNDDRSPVSFPASDSLCLAVSAMGRKGTFPVGATQAGDVASPYGTDKKNFLAAFSNVGSAVDLTGPGVGILSTVPGGYAPMDGTSMACPAACGIAANILSALPNIVALPRDEARSDAMARAVLQAAKSLGFGPTYEGQGLL
jgi:subtilisin family serine protease